MKKQFITPAASILLLGVCMWTTGMEEGSGGTLEQPEAPARGGVTKPTEVTIPFPKVMRN